MGVTFDPGRLQLFCQDLERATNIPTSLSERSQEIVFIVPRSENVLILGGLAQAHKWELDLTLESPEIVAMRERCNAFVPGLENADYDPTGPIVQGLRPFREKNVRVERELRMRADGAPSKIVHSYGHGGAGFALSFGCAGEVLDLVREAELGVPAKPMAVATAAFIDHF